ncbi:hypothetical protein V1522DRAFT_405654, partial [Lipomyces starkeyi]
MRPFFIRIHLPHTIRKLPNRTRSLSHGSIPYANSISVCSSMSHIVIHITIYDIISYGFDM